MKRVGGGLGGWRQDAGSGVEWLGDKLEGDKNGGWVPWTVDAETIRLLLDASPDPPPANTCTKTGQDMQGSSN